MIKKLLFFTNFLLLMFVAPGYAVEQIVSAQPKHIPAYTDSTVSFDVYYTTSDGNMNLPGLGLRMHWNTNALELLGVYQVFNSSLFVLGDQEENMLGQGGNGATNRQVNLSWLDTEGEWPSNGLPVRLFRVAFRVLSAGNTLVNFSSSSTAGGYDLAWEPALIRIMNATRVSRLSSALTFGNLAVGQSATRTFTIYNDGNATLSVSSITYPKGFTGDWNGGTIAAGSSRTVSVTFSPTAAQSYSGTITLYSNKTSGTSSLSCSGTGFTTTTTRTLSVNSSGASSVPIAATPSTYDGTTNYTKAGIANNTSITLTAPAISGNGDFTSWIGCNSTNVATRTCTVVMNANKSVTAQYDGDTPKSLPGVLMLLLDEE
ncbi:choice-of-anchor D domain-containing protein [Desulfonatronum sp. SC1]|uniref:choice-of-anchor D domain-containing protein n=1 Tax=Desulfonatronum sp. SC1 TaxID=2109626 RepID=UPI000D301DC9|nr:choice-of-anchor D domain-containing protein [Desulfonatronum sp. SC1]PTN35133.1 hypothetical protein C6366_11475 [Desulfonatronum sp. SC1]